MGNAEKALNNFPESRRGLGHVTLQFLAVRSAILATAWLLVISLHALRYTEEFLSRVCT